MQINDELVAYLEDLSRLRLSDEEKAGVKKDLSEILRYMDKLSELDTQDVEAVSHPMALVNRFRQDVVTTSMDRETILQNAPEQKDGCFKVPKTVE